ncbi:hypothetical protein HMPREF9124_1015 [Oribacterium sp. oral taxon 108 str. F0425]|nr:hypothetical protein HMPREF9124_1015 [Oribacterium sp. oral taxon 108 str. F0425]
MIPILKILIIHSTLLQFLYAYHYTERPGNRQAEIPEKQDSL